MRAVTIFVILMLVAFGTMWGWIRHIFDSSCTDHDVMDCPHSTAMARKFVNEE